MSKKIISPECVLSYPHLDEPVAAMNGQGEPKYSCTLLFAEGADLAAMQAAVIEAAVDKFGAKAVQMLKTGALKIPFRTDWEAKGYPEGTTFINVRSAQAPGLVYAHRDPGTKKPAIVPGDKITEVFYAGAHVRASLAAFGYDTSGNKGVSFGLNNLQKLSDGPRLDGRKAADDDFEATEELAPADLADLETQQA